MYRFYYERVTRFHSLPITVGPIDGSMASRAYHRCAFIGCAAQYQRHHTMCVCVYQEKFTKEIVIAGVGASPIDDPISRCSSVSPLTRSPTIRTLHRAENPTEFYRLKKDSSEPHACWHVIGAHS